MHLCPFGASGNRGNQMSRYEIYLWVQSVTRILRRCFRCSATATANGNVSTGPQRRGVVTDGCYGDGRPSSRADHEPLAQAAGDGSLHNPVKTTVEAERRVLCTIDVRPLHESNQRLKCKQKSSKLSGADGSESANQRNILEYSAPASF